MFITPLCKLHTQISGRSNVFGENGVAPLNTKLPGGERWRRWQRHFRRRRARRRTDTPESWRGGDSKWSKSQDPRSMSFGCCVGRRRSCVGRCRRRRWRWSRRSTFRWLALHGCRRRILFSWLLLKINVAFFVCKVKKPSMKTWILSKGASNHNLTQQLYADDSNSDLR